MKKLFKIVLVLTMSLCYFGNGLSIHAYEINPYEEDIRLYGNTVTERIVLYDESEIDLLPFAQIPGTGGGTTYISFFSKVEWIQRSGVWSLSLTPKKAIFDYETAWVKVTDAFKNDTQWKNSGNSTVNSSMYNQYVCHYKYAGTLKTPWNLEPSKVDKGYSGFVADACN